MMDRFGKTFSILKNDKLISTQKIKPILERIENNFHSFSLNLGLFLLLLFNCSFGLLELDSFWKLQTFA
jgi:hypothetical protein